jgi:hypothetical protein
MLDWEADMKVRPGSRGWPATRFVLACAAVALLAAWSLAGVAAVRRVTLEECARQADEVFVGRVVAVTTRWGDTGKMIWTDYLFQVEDTWKGKAEGYKTVSVAGGTVGRRTILLSHVPSFDLHATYVVFAYGGERLVAEGVVGVEQGLFREVTEEETGQRVLIDAFGYLMERDASGRIARGRLTRPVDGGERAHVLTPVELKDQQRRFEAEVAHAPLQAPVVRDAYGAVLHTPAPPPSETLNRSLPQPGMPMTREDLKGFTLSVLAQAPPPQACGTEGRTP